MCMNKDELRGQIRAQRRALSPQAQRAAALAVCGHALAFAPLRAAHSVMAYMACRGELDLTPVLEALLAQGKTLLLPRCEQDGRMTARRVTSLSQLAPGAYGVQEPDAACEVFAPENIGLVLAPGVAFDRCGRRLGQGGGYYDRFLARTRAMRVGICHDFALVERVPTQAHDLAMDSIITPCGIVHPDRAKEE